MNIDIIDAPAYRLSPDEFKHSITKFSPDIIGVSVYTTTFASVIKTIRILKESFPQSVIVAGGPHSSVLPEECITLANADIAVIGEGEITFTRLVGCIRAGKDLSTVPNIVFKKNSDMVHTHIQSETCNLDDLPLPARDMVEISKYKPAQGTYKRLPSLNMTTSRGCPFTCSYCSKAIFASKYRACSPEKVIAEIDHLIRNYGIKEILFNDDVFTLDNKRTEAICDLIINRKLDITWSCSTRVNLVNRDLLQKMKSSGCVSIGYGIESGDPSILTEISKGISVDTIRDAIRWTTEAGIETRTFYILGFPGETTKTMKTTVDFALQLNTDFVIFNLAIPLPGTDMYEKARQRKLLFYDGLELYKRTDGAHALIRVENLSQTEIENYYKTAYRKYYLRPGYILKRIRAINSLEELKRNMAGFLSFRGWLKAAT